MNINVLAIIDADSEPFISREQLYTQIAITSWYMYEIFLLYRYRYGNDDVGVHFVWYLYLCNVEWCCSSDD